MLYFNNILFFAYVLLISFCTKAQNISSKILDSKTQKPLALVNVIWEQGKGVSSNEAGEFSFKLPQKYNYDKDVSFSLIGYQTAHYTIRQIKNAPVIYLKPKPLTLKNVLISNVKLTTEAILDSVFKYLPENADKDGIKERQLFFKEDNNSAMTSFNFNLKKSSIAEITEEFVKNTIAEMPKKTSFLSEILATRYSNLKTDKLLISKANKLYNTNGDGALEATFNKLESLLNRNVKSDSYYKIKTGLLGFKLQADSTFIKNGQIMDIRNEFGNEDKKENFFLNNRKETLERLVTDYFLHKKTKIIFLDKRNEFNFTLEDDVAFIDNEEVYKLKATSKGKNKYDGMLYVNTYDFGIMRIDFKNNKPLRSINMFGLNYNETGYYGTAVFKKIDANYELAYMQKTLVNGFGVDRPFKIIEKNKKVWGRRKQNEVKFDLDMQMQMSTNYQILILESNLATFSKFESIDEKQSIQPKNWTKYEPNFWEAYPKIKNIDSLRNQFLEIKSTY